MTVSVSVCLCVRVCVFVTVSVCMCLSEDANGSESRRVKCVCEMWQLMASGGCMVHTLHSFALAVTVTFDPPREPSH